MNHPFYCKIYILVFFLLYIPQNYGRLFAKNGNSRPFLRPDFRAIIWQKWK
jgi:hypothetical protein